MSSLSRAYYEISNSIKGFRLTRSSPSGDEGVPILPGVKPEVPLKEHVRTASSMTTTISRAIKSATSRMRGSNPSPPEAKRKLKSFTITLAKRCTGRSLWEEPDVLLVFFRCFSARDKVVLSQVCRLWRDTLYAPVYWTEVTPVYDCKTWCADQSSRNVFFDSLEKRAFDSLVIQRASDGDIEDLINNFHYSKSSICSLSVRYCVISDSAIELLLAKMEAVICLEIRGCNELTEAVFWTCMKDRIIALSISDCVNVADDSVNAIAQRLTNLQEFNLQAYHVTDACLSYFTAKQSQSLTTLRVRACWEITNHGLLNLLRVLPNLTVLSLSGCSKITDDGIEVLTDNLRLLKVLDLSWCFRITDAGVECIACDLTYLEELNLDRCSQVSDIGVGYIFTMISLRRLFLRWCHQIRDLALTHIINMPNLQVLSLAGCHLLSSTGLFRLSQMKVLKELELTNCPGATEEVVEYLQENLPNCTIYE